MRYLVYLLTLFFIGTAIAQSPTIVQGDYITNVFGPSNFVKNPNAQINTANVTVSNATVTRGTTTPLVAKSEFTITTSTATGYADWDLRTFDAGMKNNNCEARFTYRGFTVGSTKAQILQGANVVAELTLVGDANNPKQASINFPCGDLSAVTKFRLQQASASLTGTNEIGGIYVGLATNMANVAQAENVVQVSRTTTQSFTSNVVSTLIYTTETKDVYGEYDTSNGKFTAKRAGEYLINSSILSDTYSWSAGNLSDIIIAKNGSPICRQYKQIQATQTVFLDNQVTCTIRLEVGETIETQWRQDRGTTNSFGGGQYVYMNISRFPSSSELVVTPERQNVFGGVVYTGSTNNTLFSAAAEPTAFSSFNNAGWNQPTMLKGKAAVTTTNSGNDLGISIPNMPVGSYKVEISGLIGSTQSGDTGITKTSCNFKIVETTTSTDVAKQAHQDWSTIASTNEETRDWPMSFHGVFNNTAVSTRNFRLEAQKYEDTTTGNIGVCQAYTNASGLQTYISFLITPLDQPTNSALYVQGPVLGAQTGAAIPTGYVGETKIVQTTTLTNYGGSNAYQNLGTITLDPGVWSCSALFHLNRNAATFTNTQNTLITFSDTTGGPGYVFLRQGGNYSNVIPTTFDQVPLQANNLILRSNGSQITWPDGVARGTTTLYILSYVATYTAGTPQYELRAQCVRIN